MKRMLSVVLSVCILLTYGVTAYADTPSVEVTTDVLQDGEVELESYIEWNSYKSKIDGCDRVVLDEIKSAEDRGVLPDVYPINDHAFVVKTDLGFYGFDCVDGVYYSKSTMHFAHFLGSTETKSVYVGTGTPTEGEVETLPKTNSKSLGCCQIKSLTDYGYAPNGDFYVIFYCAADIGSSSECLQQRITNGASSYQQTSRWVGVRITSDGSREIMWHSRGLNGYDSGDGYNLSISPQSDACYVQVDGGVNRYFLDRFEWGIKYTWTTGIECEVTQDSSSVGDKVRGMSNTYIDIEPSGYYPSIQYGNDEYNRYINGYSVTDSGYRRMHLTNGVINNYKSTGCVITDKTPWYGEESPRGIKGREIEVNQVTSYQVDRFQEEGTKLLNQNNIPYIVRRGDRYNGYTTKITSTGSNGVTYTDGNFYLVKKYRPQLGEDGLYVLNKTTVLNIGNGMSHNAMKLTFSDLSLGSNASIKIYGGYISKSSPGKLLETITNSKNSLGTYTTKILPYGSVTVVFTAGTSTTGRGVGFNITDVQYSKYKGGKEFNSEKVDVYPIQAPNIGYSGAVDAPIACNSIGTNSWSTTLNTAGMQTRTDVLLKSNVTITGQGTIKYTGASSSYYPYSSYFYIKLVNTMNTSLSYPIYSSRFSSYSTEWVYDTSGITPGTYNVYGYTRSTGYGSYTVTCSETKYNVNQTTTNYSFTATGGRTIDGVGSSLVNNTINVNKTNFSQLNSTSTYSGTVSTDVSVKAGYCAVVPTKYTTTNTEGIVVYPNGPSLSSITWGDSKIYCFSVDGALELYMNKTTSTVFSGSIPIKVYKTKDETYTYSGSNIKSRIIQPKIEYCTVSYTPTNVGKVSNNRVYDGNTYYSMYNTISRKFNVSSSYALKFEVNDSSAIKSSSSVTLTLGRSLVNLLKYDFDVKTVSLNKAVSGKSILSHDLAFKVNNYTGVSNSSLYRDIYIYNSAGSEIGYLSGCAGLQKLRYNGKDTLTIKTRVYPGYQSSSHANIAQTLTVVQNQRNNDNSDYSYRFTSDKTFTYYVGADETLFNKIQVTNTNIPNGVEVYIDGTKITGTWTSKYIAKQYIPIEVKIKANSTYGNLKTPSADDLISYTLYSKYAKDKSGSGSRYSPDNTQNNITTNGTYSKAFDVSTTGDCYVNPVTSIVQSSDGNTHYGLYYYQLDTGYGTWKGSGGGINDDAWYSDQGTPTGDLGWFPCSGRMSYEVKTHIYSTTGGQSYYARGRCLDYYYVLKPENISKEVIAHNGESNMVSRDSSEKNTTLLSGVTNSLSDSYVYNMEYFGERKSTNGSSKVGKLGYPTTLFGTITGNVTNSVGSGSAFINSSSTMYYDGKHQDTTYYDSTSSQPSEYSWNNFKIQRLRRYDPSKINITDSSVFESDSKTAAISAKLSYTNTDLNKFGDIFKTTEIAGKDRFDDGRIGIPVWEKYDNSQDYSNKTLVSVNVQKTYPDGEVRTLARVGCPMLGYYSSGSSTENRGVTPTMRHIGNDLMFIQLGSDATGVSGTKGHSLAWLRTGHWIVNPEEEGVELDSGSKYPNIKALSSTDDSDVETIVESWDLESEDWQVGYQIKDGKVTDSKMSGGLAMNVQLGSIAIVRDENRSSNETVVVKVPGLTSFNRIILTMKDEFGDTVTNNSKVMIIANTLTDDTDDLRVTINKYAYQLEPGQYSVSGLAIVNGKSDVPVTLNIKVIDAPSANGKTNITFDN